MPTGNGHGRRRVLLIAFAYEPGAGSEPGVGFDTAMALSRDFDVTVVTDRVWPGMRDDTGSTGGPDVIRMELEPWPARWNPHDRQTRLEFYYYAWIRMVGRRLPDIIRERDIDMVQHVTYVRYWMPSAVDTAGRPFIWGPVGGGEAPSAELLGSLPDDLRRSERFRAFVRAVAERDPAVARTGREADLALAATPETADRMRRLTDAPVLVHPAVSLSTELLESLGRMAPMGDGPVRFLSIGRLLGWKGFDLAVEAMANMRHRDVRLDVIGDGDERARLEALSHDLGVSDRVQFLGRLDRAETLERIAAGHALLHPSLHDSGGMVCLEAMAAGRPVVCLEGNGPAALCGETGLTVPMSSRSQVVRDLAHAMDRLATDRTLLQSLGELARRHVASEHSTERRARDLVAHYERIWADRAGRARSTA